MLNRRWRGAFVVAAVALPCALAGAEARAQGADVDPATLAEAQALHAEAIAALDAKDYATACPKLARVVHMIPQGIGALLTLAECYEGAGRLASAWEAYVAVEKAAGKAGQQERQRVALQKVVELQPKLARLTIVVPDTVRGLPGLEIRRGANVVESAQWGVGVPVDAASYVVVATAPGKRRWEKSVAVPRDGVDVSVTVEALEDEAPAAPPPASMAPKPGAPVAPTGPRGEESAGAGWGVQRTAGWILGGAGVVGVGVGVAFGVRAISKKNASNADGHCHDGNLCDDEGFALREAGYTAGTVSTVLFVVGGAAVAGGAALVWTAPSKEGAAQAEIAVGPQGLSLRGRW